MEYKLKNGRMDDGHEGGIFKAKHSYTTKLYTFILLINC